MFGRNDMYKMDLKKNNVYLTLGIKVTRITVHNYFFYIALLSTVTFTNLKGAHDYELELRVLKK